MTNPLQNYFRKPEIYMKLPSQGRWYPPGVLELNEAGEVGIMAMTARDEMIVRTPDALLNGQATVDVIKSCVPAISDPWCIPQMDIDTILLGIRIATYGSGMDFTTAPPGIALTQEVKVDLNKLVSMIKIGEETGALSFMLENLANFYKREVEEAVTILTKAMEPAVIFVVAAIVGTIVISLYLPMFSLINTMG